MTADPDSLADAWLARTRAKLVATALGPRIEQIGRVEEVGDGIALVSGLPTVRLDELLRFDKGQFGFAQVLERGHIGCVLLDDVNAIEAGDTVRGTGDVVRVPVGPALLGRIVDPLARPLDGKGAVATDLSEPIERPAPEIMDRDLVTRPVQTGLIVVDALFALGRGQRELIVGDRAIGKTTIAIDTIISQKTTDMVCVYVSVGQKSSSVRRAIEAITTFGALDRCIVVVAGSSSSPGLQWIAPFSAFTMAEYFRDRGGHALIVVDDLTKHAASHREIALLTRQSPGREAYPGDVFYVHARLLERAAKLSEEKGGGSLTALPIAETDAGNLSAYIPTNLISITDGQIVLNTKLFHEGQKPAVDVGTSVSRVGGKTQAPALRAAAETLRLDYAQFLELETFTRFGGMPDTRIRDQLTRGARIRAILDQPQHSPLRLADEVALIVAVQSGLLDQLAPSGDSRLPAGLARRGRQRCPRRRSPDPGHRYAGRSRKACASRGTTAVRSDADPGRNTAGGGETAVTGRLSDLSAHIAGIHQLGAVVNAMRGIAAARAQDARGRLSAVDGYAATIALAIGRTLALLPLDHSTALGPPARPALVLFCAEQGFAGAFSERVLDAVKSDLSASELFLIGTRGIAVAAERGVQAGWTSPMPSHPAGVPKLADRISEALYARIAKGEIDRLDAIFGQWQPGGGIGIERRRLWPLDMSGFPRPTNANAPLLNLASEALLIDLTADYVHAQLCKTALHAFAAENEARMEAMASAHGQIDRQLSELQAAQRIVRQEEITAEIIELAAGETASRTAQDRASNVKYGAGTR